MPRRSAPTPTHTQREQSARQRRVRVLITAGPTYEPIDRVRFIGNRSSGRLGVELADAAASRGHRVTLLLGPTSLLPLNSSVKVKRFQSTADLDALLDSEFGRCDVLIQAAAIADYTVASVEGGTAGPGQKAGTTEKLRRDPRGLVLRLTPTPDLLAKCAARRATDGTHQRVIGFALEPAARLLSSARDKLARKGVDAIVANELSTMDSPNIRAIVIFADGREVSTGKTMTKKRFAGWLLDQLPIAAPHPAYPRRSARGTRSRQEGVG